MRNITGIIAAGIFALLALTIVFGSWYTVQQYERGVLLRNGAIVGIEQPGLHFKTPWLESVQKIPVTTRTRTYEKMESYSADQQPADIRVSVTYHVAPDRAGDVYARFASVDALESRIIDPHVLQEVKVVFGQYTAQSAIAQRAKLNVDAAAAVTQAIGSDSPIVVEGVQIEDFTFSPDYIKAVEARMQAEVGVQQQQQKALTEKINADIALTQAQGRANSAVAEAKARADATGLQATAEANRTRLLGQAEADAIRARGDALRDNPSVVALTQAERWDGKLPTTMVPGSTLPFLSLPH